MYSQPSSSVRERLSAGAPAGAETALPASWQYDVYMYPDVMTMVAELHTRLIAPPHETRYTVAAFCGEECRGVGQWVGDWLFLTVHGEAGKGDIITLRCYDAETGEEQGIVETFVFDGQCLGSLAEPVALHADGRVTKIGAAPADNNRPQRIYSPDGRLLDRPQRGLNIIVRPNGMSRKSVM